MSKRNISAQDKINAVKRYLNGLTSRKRSKTRRSDFFPHVC